MKNLEKQILLTYSQQRFLLKIRAKRTKTFRTEMNFNNTPISRDDFRRPLCRTFLFCSLLKILLIQTIERFSFECRKVIGFALSTRCDWLKRFAPPFHPIRSKTKANCDALACISRALRQPHVITSSFDWFNVLSVCYVIGQSNYFGFGFTTLKRKPLYPINAV